MSTWLFSEPIYAADSTDLLRPSSGPFLFSRMIGYGARVSLPPPFGFVPEPTAAPDDMSKGKQQQKTNTISVEIFDR